MPKAIALAYGLDWETEIASFWSWLEDAGNVIEEGAGPSSKVRELVASQRERIEGIAASQAQPEAARFTLTVAVALVGLHFSSNQKLLACLQDYGAFEPPRQRPTFDTYR